uniref:Ion transport domain-containing protein n=1 Tax=Tetraselmis sp. GSL018 TaxID=582737 RepID=A0A061RB51_9CHLO
MYLLGANKRGGQLSTATEEEVSKYLSRFQLRRSSSDGSRNFSSRGRPTNYLLGKYLAVSRFCHSVVHQSAFGGFITSAIVVASLLVGIQTYPGMDYIPGREDNTRAGRILNILDQTVLAVFAAEIVLKIVAEGRRPWRFFASGGHGSHAAGHRRSEADPEEEMWNKSQMGSTRSAAVEPPPALRLRVDFWNVFDFAVVVVCYLPLGASMLAVIRLFRLLRVLKLLRVLPGLQILVIGLLTSLSSISYVVASAAAGLLPVRHPVCDPPAGQRPRPLWEPRGGADDALPCRDSGGLDGGHVHGDRRLPRLSHGREGGQVHGSGAARMARGAVVRLVCDALDIRSPEPLHRRGD